MEKCEKQASLLDDQVREMWLVQAACDSVQSSSPAPGGHGRGGGCRQSSQWGWWQSDQWGHW